ncbi:toluene ABC transporter periplasmic protein [Neoasaia chiangmaiensis NBRC 101099]|uniref:Organic solvent ABC transporter substrate-binding protein n=2 Tax=Neoasaia chiangmaiensis TaxID=320497 RepID=A0A1U9KTQ5_9PROT|nr:MlaD family protein [Neoasaia chiangmaiensis]AQS89226.1 organic solvent ABC transporter substrate-binding protein [Neoasaia chiangmaiensis]GBR37889.1 toluene ABC transporter periplasmic protein [Neoasaia chiangmaiensis NBRC 101099]GEN15171.1 outer membrane lipid asymmetry maintenance protein MlaD [Neoasaia chiangmaiensis]
MVAEARGGAIVSSGLVLVAAVLFTIYANQQRQGAVRGGEPMHARFVSANGLAAGADVTMAGVPVGSVQRIFLDARTQMATVDFTLDPTLRLPTDSVVQIGAPTLTADNALQIAPGHAKTVFPSGSTIQNTRDQVSLEQQVSNYIFGGALGGD